MYTMKKKVHAVQSYLISGEGLLEIAAHTMCDEVEKNNRSDLSACSPRACHFSIFLSVYGQLNFYSVPQIGSFHILLCMLSDLYISNSISSKCRERKNYMF